MFKVLWLCLSLCFVGGDTLLALNAKYYQLNFLQELANLAEQKAEVGLNGYLEKLLANSRYSNFTAELSSAKASQKLQTKVTLIKQLLDVDVQNYDLNDADDMEHISVLRNLVFLNRLKKLLKSARDSSAQEIRQLRVHRLCQQFDRPTSVRRKSSSSPSSLINEKTVGAALEQLNLTHTFDNLTKSINLNQFGEQLYGRVKLAGAEIIDNYLLILRGLLQDIIDAEHEDLAQNTTQLEKLLQQIDGMLAIKDFFEKRQKLYAYLERHLTTDYEQLSEAAQSEQHLTEQLLEQLKAKGLDLFVIFLFSNFEFLEKVHEQWIQLLPEMPPSLLHDDTTRLLYDIQQLYETFKLDTESTAKYEAYVKALRQLHEQTVDQGQENRHIFEMLNNAAQNVGSVTFNMIKSKCKELL
ncbi:uncharacterized protein [Drosophila tropicalis]|uniref:uncharacterized protein n=1 Tax=Drosophila tropicalis TaxID=46794 RepID=UPI0035AB9670